MARFIEQVCEFICDFGAEGVSRYVSMTGMGPEKVPEYFLTSIIADRVFHQKGHYVGMETRVSALLDWDPRVERRILTSHERLRDADIGRWKPDLLVYTPAATPEEAELLALVEVKRGYISAELDKDKRTDRSKALKILVQLDCEHIILCGSLPHKNRDYHREKRKDAETSGLRRPWPAAPMPATRLIISEPDY